MLNCGLRRASIRCSSFLSHAKRPISAKALSEPQSDLPSFAPRPSPDIQSIRTNADVYAQSSAQRNYKKQASYPYLIAELTRRLLELRKEGNEFRRRNNIIGAQLSNLNDGKGEDAAGGKDAAEERKKLLEEARQLKESLKGFEGEETELSEKIAALAVDLPNLISEHTPSGTEPTLVGYINDPPGYFGEPDCNGRDHVKLGNDLDLLDFSGGANVSGWGWYYLKNEAALLEQALIQYALNVATDHGFSIVTPPSMVYSHIGAACGFQPRDQNGEEQIYTIKQSERDQGKDKPEHVLAGTAEIPFAGLKANQTLQESDLPLCIVGPSRCYRAEAGARGRGTKGLYRVHEFTKVEMFAWTRPGEEDATFATMLGIQTKILQGLGLHCRILEMPSTDLGASAYRKRDIEAYFPSRVDLDHGWGEVTSTSICTDYQTRRLNTRVKLTDSGGVRQGAKQKLGFPSTVNGTAMAVPRVLAALLENRWDDREACVKIPEGLWPWMHGVRVIKR